MLSLLGVSEEHHGGSGWDVVAMAILKSSSILQVQNVGQPGEKRHGDEVGA